MAITKKQAWFDRRETKLDQIIAEHLDASFMSDAKWRKVLATLADCDYPLSGYHWKFVDDERVFETLPIKVGEIGEKNIIDGLNQPFVYKEVEWLEIITKHSKEVGEQLLLRAKFALEDSQSGLKIIGYRRRV